MSHRTLTLLVGLSVIVVVGCEETRNPGKGAKSSAPAKPKVQMRETVGKYTQEVRNLKPELAQGGQVTDGKIHATDYITLQADAYRTEVAKIAKMNVDYAIRLYEAENGSKPKTYEEFMDVIIKKGKADGIMLPMLPYYQEYGYDPDKQQLVVIEYPTKKKEFDEEWDRQVGRK